MPKSVPFLAAFLTCSAIAQTPIRLIYPREKMTVSTTDSLLVLGQVFGSGRLYIDGMEQTIQDDGAFVGYIPLDLTRAGNDSTVVIRCELRRLDTIFVLERTIVIPLPMSEWTNDGFDENFLFPKDDHVLTPGDVIQLMCRTRSSKQVAFEIVDSAMQVVDGPFPMREDEPYLMPDFGNAFFGFEQREKQKPAPGVYSASYVIPSTPLQKGRVRFVEIDNGDTVRQWSPGTITTLPANPLRVARLAADVNNAMVWPNRSFMYFLPRGTLVRITGYIGAYCRLQLSRHHSAWIHRNQIEILPDGTASPRSPVSVVRVLSNERDTRLRLYMSAPLPYYVHQPEPHVLELRLYGGIADVDWIRFENEDERLIQVTWSQPEDDVFMIRVTTKEPYLWGYRVRHDSLGLVWTLRHRPSERKLKNLRICIDPGHSPDVGSTGPTGLQEHAANLLVALELKRQLEKKGALVIMTRMDTVSKMSLYDRGRMANEADADIFVSIHHNAQPDGVNPRGQPFGPMMIYYHPQSRPLAESIQRELVRETRLPDMGVFMGNIAVCRNAEMPSVLVECAFLTLPEQEKRIRDGRFRKDVAESIVRGIENFAKGRK
jgi:N-acetylmuramoyl-L-alanine amidase